MFKRLKKLLDDSINGIKSIYLSDSKDTWLKEKASDSNSQEVNIVRNESVIQVVPEKVRNSTTINDLRNKIIQNEFAGENSSKESKDIRIFAPDINNPVIPCEEETDEFTEDGSLKTHSSRTYIITGQDLLITPAEMHLGSFCFVCKKFSDAKHLGKCLCCSRYICSTCLMKINDQEFCPVHYKEIMFNLDTWNQM